MAPRPKYRGKQPPTPEQIAQWKSWRHDIPAFCSEAVTVITKGGQQAPMILRPAQEAIHSALQASNRVAILKARQLGGSMYLLARGLHYCLFHANHNHLIFAHHTTPAEKLFRRDLMGMYSRLPEWLRNLYEIDTRNFHELVFAHGSRIRVSTADSESARSETAQSAHLSEAALYPHWDGSMAAILATLAPGAWAAIESTANGPNRFWDLWRAEDSGWTNLFCPWWWGPDYVGKPIHPDKWTPWEREQAERHGLTPGQVGWMRGKLREFNANTNLFLQEFPGSPDEAFILSGAPYFACRFDPAEAVDGDDGLVILDEPKPYHRYSVGVDCARGEPDGDRQAMVVIDCTVESKPIVVATYRSTVTAVEYKSVVQSLVAKYNAVAVVERTGGWGGPIIDHLVAINWPHIYRETERDVRGTVIKTRLGWETSAQSRPRMLSTLDEYLSRGMDVRDRRLKYELNNFVWISGKPQAAVEKHDDMVTALAMALQGIPWAVAIGSAADAASPPKTIEEIIQWDMSRGLWQPEQPDEDSELLNTLLFLI